MNTILNIVPQGELHVIERLGKMHAVEQSGWFIAIPFIDQIAYVIDMRERSIEIPAQSAITRDNVSVDVSGVVYVQFKDPERACYGARAPLYAVRMHAQSAMRAAIGEMELDEVRLDKERITAGRRGGAQPQLLLYPT
jgi:regulator of protease activity HflC (stomatin/prohibitin superfamily)